MSEEDTKPFGLVSTSVALREDAESLATRIVGARLAACVQILAATSVYRWRGLLEAAEEHILLIKIQQVDFDAVAALLAEHHPYDLPEIVMVPVDATSPAYGRWLTAETTR